MKPLDSFDEIIVIGHEDHALEKFQILFGQSGLSSRPATVFRSGAEDEPPEEWGGGRGSWNCLLGHVGALQMILDSGHRSALIMEQDCVWSGNPDDVAKAAAQAKGCQFYFGGQLRDGLGESSGAALSPPSVHRAHCYSVSREIIPSMIDWLTDSSNYGTTNGTDAYMMKFLKSNGVTMKIRYRHMDHLMEEAHKAGIWPVKASSWWFAGQASGQSSIRKCSVPERWWHHNPAGVRQCGLPIVVIDRNPSGPELSRLNLAVGKVQMKDFMKESFESGRFPAMQPKEAERIGHRTVPLSALRVNEGLLQEGGLLHPFFSGLRKTSHPRATRGDSGRLGHYEWSECEGIHDLTGEEFARKPFRSMKYRKWSIDDFKSLAEKAILPEVLMRDDYPLKFRKVIAAAEIVRQIGGVAIIEPSPLRQDIFPNLEMNFFVDPKLRFMGAADPGNSGCMNLIQLVASDYLRDPSGNLEFDLLASAQVENHSYLGKRWGTRLSGLDIVVSSF